MVSREPPVPACPVTEVHPEKSWEPGVALYKPDPSQERTSNARVVGTFHGPCL